MLFVVFYTFYTIGRDLMEFTSAMTFEATLVMTLVINRGIQDDLNDKVQDDLQCDINQLYTKPHHELMLT